MAIASIVKTAAKGVSKTASGASRAVAKKGTQIARNPTVKKLARKAGEKATQQGDVILARSTVVEEENLGPEKTHYRIKIWVFLLMLIVATILDLISIIPAANEVTLIIAGILFPIWWWFLGLGLVDFKKILSYAITIGVEVIPGLSALPGILFSVIAVFIMSRTEDKLGITLIPKLKLGKTKLARKKGGGGSKKIARSKTTSLARKRQG